jgi:hypothetical protein
MQHRGDADAATGHVADWPTDRLLTEIQRVGRLGEIDPITRARTSGGHLRLWGKPSQPRLVRLIGNVPPLRAPHRLANHARLPIVLIDGERWVVTTDPYSPWVEPLLMLRPNEADGNEPEEGPIRKEDLHRQRDTLTPADVAATHPGFTVRCTTCGSERVVVTDSLGWSCQSGSWGSVDLQCLDCDQCTEVAGS